MEDTQYFVLFLVRGGQSIQLSYIASTSLVSCQQYLQRLTTNLQTIPFTNQSSAKSLGSLSMVQFSSGCYPKQTVTKLAI